MRSIHLYRYVGFLFLLECNKICEVVASAMEKQLLKDILRNYDPRIRPVAVNRDIINVTFSLTLQQIIDLDEKNQLLTTSMYMGWRWQDAFLRWKPEDHGGVSEVRLPASYVWTPDILVYNSAVPEFDQMLKTNLIVKHTGDVEWLPPGLFQTTCDVDIRYFPFDEQQCQIKFGSWTHHAGLVNLHLLEEHAVNDSYTPSGEWTLLSMRGKRTAKKYECCGNVTFVDITYTIHIRRRTLFYGFNLLLPCVLVCSLTVLVFLLPADSGERITLGITILLALVVFLQLVTDNLPPTDVIPLLGKYFACSIVVVTASVLAAVISLNFHHTNASNTNEMPPFTRWLFLHFLPKLLRMKRPGKNSFRRKFLDYSTGFEECSGKLIDYSIIAVEDRLKQWNGGKPDHMRELTLLREAQKEITDILTEIRFITNRLRNDDKDESTALEWRFAATVLDRWYATAASVLSLLLLSVLTLVDSFHDWCGARLIDPRSP